MSNIDTLAQRLCTLLDTPAVRVVVEARLGNCGSDFADISWQGLASLRDDTRFVQAAGDVLASLELQTDYI
jgi:hypothetical protein